jgi:hypothetical protein
VVLGCMELAAVGSENIASECTRTVQFGFTEN